MDWLANQQPERAERLKALRESARKQAALARQWGKSLRRGRRTGTTPPARPAIASRLAGAGRRAMAAMWSRRNAIG
jgi:hypothetical protein